MQTLRIVLVDDEPKPMIEKKIKAMGHQLECFQNPDIAFNHIRKKAWEIDLILIDQVFKNNTEDSKIRSGLQLGESVSKSFKFIPMVMLTVNSYLPDTSQRAIRDSGFIFFHDKSDWSINEIPGILKDVLSSVHFKDKIALRAGTKKRQLLDYFSKLNKGQRKKLKGLLDSGEKLKEKNIEIGSLKSSVSNLLTGWLEVDVMTEKEIKQAISELLHSTDKDIIFKGEWENKRGKSSVTRLLLEEYETSPSYEERRHSIDFDSINYLLEVIAIEKRYKSEKEERLKKNFITELTYECTPNNIKNRLYFKQKMIGRRVAIAHKKLYHNGNSKLTLLNLLMLFKLSKTGTYKLEKDFAANIHFKDYGNIPSSCEPKNILNTALGLSYLSISVRQKEDLAATKSKTKKKVDRFEYYVQDEPEYILFEELEWYNTIAQYGELIYDFLENFTLPKDVTIHSSLVGDYYDLNDFQKMVLMIQSQKNASYDKLLKKIKHELETRHAALVPAIEYLLDLNLKDL